MSEWWTYTPGDFLMFSARSYHRLVERYNADVWPLHALAIGAGLAALVLAARPRSRQGQRWVSAILGLAWLWSGWAFHERRFATINWAAEYAAWAFAAQGLALLSVGVAGERLAVHDFHARCPDPRVALVAFAVVCYPLVAVTLGRPWSQAEVFGLMPDPTAAATLGWLLLAAPRRRWLMLVPLASCLGSGVMLLTMGSADGWIPLLIVALAVALAWRQCAREGSMRRLK